jgi:hypothetical protein
MRVLLGVLLTVLGYISWQLGLIQAVANVGDSALKEPVTIEERIATELLMARQLQGHTPLTPDREVEEWLLTSDHSGSTSPEALAESIRRKWPQYQDVRVLDAYSLFDDGIVERVMGWTEATAAELTHVSVAVKPGPWHAGSSVTIVAGMRLPLLSAKTLNDPNHSLFYSTCTLCKESQPCKIPRPAPVLKLRCQHCQHVYAMLAVDTQGNYRPVNEFLTGYMPPNTLLPGPTKLQELMAIWQAETQLCRYLTDGRKEHDDAWQTARETRELRQGDCEDSAILLADWLLTRGFQARVAIGRYDAKKSAHAWVTVRVDGSEFLLESTEAPLGLQRPPLVRELGARYVPELLFDRSAIYIPKGPDATVVSDYWSEDRWQRVSGEPEKEAVVSSVGVATSH